MKRGGLTFILVIMSLGLFQGCGTGYAPVTDRSMEARQVGTPVSSQAASNRPAPLPNPGSYTVNRGDTLYSISFRYGLDYREVARWNNVNDRFQIFPGQVLRLTPPTSGGVVASAPVQRAQTTPTTQPSPPQSAQSTTHPQRTQQQPAQQPVQQQTQQQATNRQQSSPPPVSSTQQPAVAGQPVWRWPANGPIIRRFSAAEGGNKGIHIAGLQGDPVVAAADGRVVYAGSGLLGYGNLVIINHNREFLSAYAHNSRILVSENDMVKAGDKIAEMGQTGTDRVQLHFEIRRNGKPVDPMSYLPRR